MPSYTYQVIHEDGTEGELFEVVHGMNDPPLTVHPQTGKPVQRVFSPPHVAGWANERQSKQRISDANLEKHGFTKYVRSGKGNYEKRTGQGPSSLHAGD
jgi:hypothetical protein